MDMNPREQIEWNSREWIEWVYRRNKTIKRYDEILGTKMHPSFPRLEFDGAVKLERGQEYARAALQRIFAASRLAEAPRRARWAKLVVLDPLQERCGLKGRADFDAAMDYGRWRAERRALGIQETNEAAIKRFRGGRRWVAKASGGTPQTARPYPYRAPFAWGRA
jgi:hypothetical protein